MFFREYEMDRIWKKILFIGSPSIILASVIYYFVSVFSKSVSDNNFNVKFLIFVVCILCLFISFCLYQILKKKKNSADEMLNIFVRYRFLLSQLVGKEFKLKYRRSYLGIAWSLINPLLMMIVVSAVFSFVFRFNIENFPAYLILGQTMFNFFSEATQLSLLSIVQSGQLVKRVYVPKCIFPLSRVLSSAVNFLITFISVIIVFAYYKIYPNILILYLPLFMAYFFVFTFGICLILSTIEVFMRDILHLYSVVLTALGYVTPIFYPVDSLSPLMITLLNFNPLYHFLKYYRNILFYHQCPTVTDNAICLGLALVSLVIGMLCFFKNQKKFILYI